MNTTLFNKAISFVENMHVLNLFVIYKLPTNLGKIKSNWIMIKSIKEYSSLCILNSQQ